MSYDTQIFRQIDLFWGMNDQELTMFRDIATVQKFSAGDTIFNEGDDCDKLYIVIKGSIAITTQLADGTMKTLGVIIPGVQFGEMALIDDAPRAATATAAEDSELLSVTRDSFLDLIEQNPTFSAKALINLSRTLSSRLRNTNELLRQSMNWNLKISGATDMGLSKLIEDNSFLKVRMHGGEEIKGLLLGIEKNAWGSQLIIDDAGETVIIPTDAVLYITGLQEHTTTYPFDDTTPPFFGE